MHVGTECEAERLRELQRTTWARCYAAQLERAGMGYREARRATDPERAQRERKRAKALAKAQREAQQVASLEYAHQRHARWSVHDDALVMSADRSLSEIARIFGRTVEVIRRRRVLKRRQAG